MVFPQGHTKALTGRHGRILLNKLSDGKVTYDGKCSRLFMLLADIQQFAAARILTDEEIQEFHVCIQSFVDEFGKAEYDIIAKRSQHIHVLICHVLPFVDRHKTWGLFSDQCKIAKLLHLSLHYLFQHLNPSTKAKTDFIKKFPNVIQIT